MPDRTHGRKILLVTNWVGWGGAETQLDYLAVGLADLGYDVRLLAIGEILRDASHLVAAGVKIATFGVDSRGAKLRRLPTMIRMARAVDLVHCTGWDATLWGRIAAILAGRPAVITEHTPGRDHQVTSSGASRARLIALHNRLLDRFTKGTIIVGAWQRTLLEAEGVSGDGIVQIPNAVPIEQLRQRATLGPTREDLGIPVDARVIVQVARFKSQKRQMTTLQATARLRGRLNAHVVFLGEGTEEPRVRAEADRLGADWAHFVGFREDVPGVLALADLSVLPSAGEGLPMSLIESIALGTPVVATDVGDVRWLIETTSGGICVPADDDEAFFEACARLLCDPALRREVGARGQRAIATFDAPVMVARYDRVFRACLAGELPPQPELEV